jgi:hypothetical protein
MSKKWNNDYFVRVPKEMFNDMVWNSTPFSKSKAYAHLYSMAHDGRNSTIIETEKGDVFKLNPGEVCRGLRTLANIFGWGKDKVSKWLKDYEQLGYLKVRTDTPVTVVKILGWIPINRHYRDSIRTPQGQDKYRARTVSGLINNNKTNKIKENKERVISPDILNLFQLFVRNQESKPDDKLIGVIESSLGNSSYELMKQAISNYHASGDQKEPHWFFKADYWKYLKHKQIYNWECPECDYTETSDSRDYVSICKKCHAKDKVTSNRLIINKSQLNGATDLMSDGF